LAEVQSYEDSIKYCGYGFFKSLCEELFGKSAANDIMQNLILSNDEILVLIERFEALYLFPTYFDSKLVSESMQLEISTVGFISKYERADPVQLRQIVCNITKTYYQETRDYNVDVFVPVLSANRLVVEIPLSERSRTILYQHQCSMPEKQKIYNEGLTEEFVYEEDSEDSV
jgi:hypothetical protein